jgi:DNA-binding MarR family transcriptional regulator
MSARETSVQVWRVVLLAQDAVVRAIESDLAAAGAIDLSWYDVLLELDAAPEGRLRMQELADRNVLSRSRVSRLVDELVDEGYVERLPDPGDRRANLAHITRSGRAALRRAAPIYLAGIETHFTSHLTPDEQDATRKAFERVLAAHRSTAPPRRRSP